MLEHLSPRPGRLRRGLRTSGAAAVLSPWGRCALLVVLLSAAGCSVLAWDVEQLLMSGWPLRLTGAGAALGFAVVYAVCTLAFVPKPLLNTAAGVLFGMRYGLLLAVLGTTLGALAAFALGRALGRDALRPLLRHRVLRAMDRQLSGHGFRSVLLMRLVPGVPFAVANYTAAISRMRTWPFTAATALGVIPNTAAYVTAGSYATSPDSPAFLLSLAAIGAMGLFGTAGTWWFRRRARRTASRTVAVHAAVPAATPSADAAAVGAGAVGGGSRAPVPFR